MASRASGRPRLAAVSSRARGGGLEQGSASGGVEGERRCRRGQTVSRGRRGAARASEGGLDLERDQRQVASRRPAVARDSRATGGGVERDGERTGKEVAAVLCRGRAKVASSPRPRARSPAMASRRPAVASRLEATGGGASRDGERTGEEVSPLSVKASEGGLEQRSRASARGVKGDPRWRQDSRATGGGVERDGERTGKERTQEN
ncbi:uncharacterized protein LOC120292063 [Eucalyptus grandis]|uniref:uncharacterized protein LOC120292063 n=1 Tax=Eucalyptus grandis TaxID=71139 RepID=UPI00192E823A|nr:uncharacterized protein LOC120292063 [Eucalyptus grandis]